MKLTKLFAVVSLASVAPIVGFTSRMGRTIVLSRLLSPTEFGIGAALTVVLGFGELITDIAIDRFLMASARHNDREVLASAHWLIVTRGCVLASCLFLAAPWIAQYFGVPEQVWSFRIVSAVSFLRAFGNLELKQVMRDFRYGPEAMANTLSSGAVLAVVYPAALWFHDHRAVILILFVECIVYVVASHFLSRNRFSIFARDPRILREAITYGLPLTVNGIALALVSQLDRVLVGHYFGPETLALYAIILNLTVIPVSFISGILGSLGMSLLVRARHDIDARDRSLILIWVFAVAGAGYAVFVGTTADILSPLIFGHIYALPPIIHILITVTVWMRINRSAPTTIMLTHGQTRQLMIANLVGAVGLIPAALLLPHFPELDTMLGCLLLGDFLALACFYWMLRQRLTNLSAAISLNLSWSFVVAVGTAFLIPFLSSKTILDHGWALALGTILVGAQALYGFYWYIIAPRRISAGSPHPGP
jgi:O-antigen/teichoic acid export membrane protein